MTDTIECAACGAINTINEGEIAFCVECDALLTTDAD